ncbi:pantothenate kinase [Mycobacterium tuberculosis CAS/NITR204]|uniref:Pantothenate kinase n=1 Tax=Mycobacterium tuberculosis CAS/NITR204 TaxID=1310114 RepID=R4M4L1_MYCTX|nr:pantothenate kinase [Mycobacterium tuberculosis CAS/NITR204]
MSTPLALTEEELVGLRGLGEQIDLLEVEEVYLPLARLIHLQVAARQRLFAATAEFLGEPQQNPDRPVPFIIGVAAVWRSASPPPPACCRRCWLAGITTPG